MIEESVSDDSGASATTGATGVTLGDGPRILSRDEHSVSRKQISPNALKVLYRLINSDFEAFLVGGGVRDLLLGVVPKDFDVVTNATPEEIHGLFRNSRIIGRRFKLVHVRFGREIIEVSTFRSGHEAEPSEDDFSENDFSEDEFFDEENEPNFNKLLAKSEPNGNIANPFADDSIAAAFNDIDDDFDDDEVDDEEQQNIGAETGNRPEASNSERELSASGMILRDNVFGTIEEDAFRRDFTVNALYYTPKDFSVHDFTGGLEDLEARRLVMIGNPAQRYQEDPVRMLRALRLSAKLELTIDDDARDAMEEFAPLLAEISPARLFDELVKLFLQGSAQQTLEHLLESALFEQLLPATAEAIDSKSQKLLVQSMVNTDERIAQDRPVTAGFLLAALLWPAVNKQRLKLESEQVGRNEALEAACSDILERQSMRTAYPRRFSQFARETWLMQTRLEQKKNVKITRVLSHPKFRAGYDLLLLRVHAGELPDERAEFWTKAQEDAPEAVDQGRNQSRAANRSSGRRSGGRRGRRPQNNQGEQPGIDGANAANAQSGSATAGNTDGRPPRKRRRRRRKPQNTSSD